MLTSYVCGARGWMTADSLAALAPVWEMETACSRNVGSFLENSSGSVLKSTLGGSRQPGILLLIHLVFPPLVPTSGLAWSKNRRVMGRLMGR